MTIQERIIIENSSGKWCNSCANFNQSVSEEPCLSCLDFSAWRSCKESGGKND